MAACSECKFHKKDDHGLACTKPGLEHTDHVEGRRECFNPDGDCEHFQQRPGVTARGLLISGVIIVVTIGAVLFLHEWSERTEPQRTQAKIARQLKKEQIAARLAKQPVRVWKGTVGEIEVYIEEFHPFRQ